MLADTSVIAARGLVSIPSQLGTGFQVHSSSVVSEDDAVARADVTAVIVSYNTATYLRECLRSLLDTADDIDIEIVVVDNASVDDSPDLVAAEFPNVTLIALDDNVGFARACNIGARAGHGEHILLLNPDASLRPGCVQALLDLRRRFPATEIVGGRALHEDGALNPTSCFGLPSLWGMFCFGVGLSTIFARSAVFNPESLGRWARDTERQVGVVTGCLLLCRRTFWDALDGLDETYFVYGEDVDFAIRARRLGAQARIAPAAEFVHIGGVASETSAAKWTMMLRGKVTLMRLRWSPPRAALGIRLLLLGTWLRAVGARMHLPVRGPWIENWARRSQWLAGWDGPQLT